MSADLTAEQFMKRYNRLVDLYTNSISTTDSDYEALLFDNRLPWRSKTAGRLSNLFTTAMFALLLLLFVSIFPLFQLQRHEANRQGSG